MAPIASVQRWSFPTFKMIGYTEHGSTEEDAVIPHSLKRLSFHASGNQTSLLSFPFCPSGIIRGFFDLTFETIFVGYPIIRLCTPTSHYLLLWLINFKNISKHCPSLTHIYADITPTPKCFLRDFKLFRGKEPHYSPVKFSYWEASERSVIFSIQQGGDPRRRKPIKLILVLMPGPIHYKHLAIIYVHLSHMFEWIGPRAHNRAQQ